MSGTVLILGASGRFGRNAAEAFWNAGWRVKEFDRATGDLNEAACSVDVIVNGWNPPYPAWEREVPGLTAQVIAAAKASGATVIIPGNVYGYGPGAGPVIDRDTPEKAKNPLGQVRIAMEAAYRAADIQTIVVRAGDYIDTEASGNWFDKIVVAKAAKGQITAPGDPTVPHAWAFLPDLARAAVALAEKRSNLDRFENVLFPGFTLSVNELAKLVAQATGTPQTVKPLNWLPLRAASLVWPMGRKLIEMRYLWDMPHRIEGAYFNTLLPTYCATDPLVAIAKATSFLALNADNPTRDEAIKVAAE